MSDFRFVVDFFFCYHAKLEPPIFEASSQVEDTVEAVRVNCIGDRAILNRPHFEAVKISSEHPIFEKHISSDIGEHVGMPVWTHRIRPSTKWHSSRKAFSNMPAVFLHIRSDPDQAGWGLARREWMVDVGSILVVRPDKKPLHPLQVKTLATYCEFEVMELMQPVMEHNEPPRKLMREIMRTIICRAGFKEYCNKLIAAQASAANVPNPLDV